MTPPVSAQAPVDVYELADYRLTKDVFDRFVQANASIVNIIEEDASFNDAPLFTKDIAPSGDAVAEAAGETRFTVFPQHVFDPARVS